MPRIAPRRFILYGAEHPMNEVENKDGGCVGQTVREAGKGATIAYRVIQSRGCSGAEPYFCGSALM